MKRVLFVCLGNICRSPAADGMLNYMVKKEGLSDMISVDSAGTCAHHVGERADFRMREAARQRGIPLESISRQFIPSDFERFDYIVMMDRSNMRNVKSLDPQGIHASKLHMMSDFCNSFEAEEVPDPYYGGQKGFDLVLDMVEDGCRGLIDRIKKEGQ